MNNNAKQHTVLVLCFTQLSQKAICPVLHYCCVGLVTHAGSLVLIFLLPPHMSATRQDAFTGKAGRIHMRYLPVLLHDDC